MGSRPREDASRVLVTGAAGFIGSQVAAELAQAGHEVTAIDNVNGAYDPRIKEWRIAHVLGAHPEIRFLRQDVLDRDGLAELVRRSRPHAIYHLAARAGVRVSVSDPWTYLDANATGTLNVLEAARHAGITRVLIASTSSLYGDTTPLPFREDAQTDRPLSPYAASKKAAEAMAASYAHLYGMDVPVVRYFTVYGPAGRPDMSIFRFVRNIVEGKPITVYGDGTQSRDFTFVSDIAHGTTLVATRVKGFDVVNLGGDRPLRLDEVIGMIEKIAGSPAIIRKEPMQPADVAATWADISKARAFGWTPQTSFEERIRATVDWYIANRGWARDVQLEVAA